MRHTTGVIVLNYNNAADTMACIDSLRAITEQECNHKIVIVDNCSARECVESIDRYVEGFDSSLLLNEGDATPRTLPYITHLRLEHNYGYAQGNNRGLDLVYADEEIDRILIINNDILFTQSLITPLNESLDSLSDCAIITPLLYKRDGQSVDHNCARKAITKAQIFWVWAMSFRTTFGIVPRIYKAQSILPTAPADERFVRLELPSGSCMLCDKQLFRDLGSFDPNTFLYYEENILWEKIRPTGLVNYLDREISAIHLGAATTNTKAPSVFIAKVTVESVRYYLRHYVKANWLYMAAMEIFFAAFKFKIKIRNLLCKR